MYLETLRRLEEAEKNLTDLMINIMIADSKANFELDVDYSLINAIHKEVVKNLKKLRGD